MHHLTAAQAVKGTFAWAVLATLVPLFGIVLIPILTIAAICRGIAIAGAALASLVRTTPSPWSTVAARGPMARSGNPAA
ncbi:hypothetical protein [Anaeromyxobacter dehalogenans]|uniref:Uncharacterized protein n=1 Tax=Anaeromyxobacter dehalogenans (strain 2CP-C) TaxID=290397 RepID=Q2IK56_ANADE|nr:hypothetical protein [Anaeromyxobacter dehalogenans]ABC82034.1 hypothetical protein Adeh_2264 [Anaeromyxobacter dehalogenans 2CP-C]